MDYKSVVDAAIGPKKEKGLLNKYIVLKSDKSPIDWRADYFVLRLDEFQNDSEHRTACLKALKTYADEIDNLELKKDLYNKYNLINL
jgi:hypothetical protein